MKHRNECPACGSHDTERVHTEWMVDMIEETRVCNDDECRAQFTNSWFLFDSTIDEVPS